MRKRDKNKNLTELLVIRALVCRLKNRSSSKVNYKVATLKRIDELIKFEMGDAYDEGLIDLITSQAILAVRQKSNE